MVVLRVHIDIGLAVGGVSGIVVLLASPTRDFGLLLTLAALTCLSVAPLVALALAACHARADRRLESGCRMTPERQAICDRLNAATAERRIADEHAAACKRDVDKIDDELTAYDKAARIARAKAAAKGAA